MEEETYGLEKLHKLLIIALDEFDAICRNNGINYSLHGGTLLGAVRSNSFIPWDDDADVSMTRDEYIKFRNVMQNYKGVLRLEENLIWVPRLVIKEKDRVTCIDIFIWDYISEKKWEQFLKLNTLRAVQGMLKKEIEYQNYSFFNKVLLFVTHNFGKLFSYKMKLKLYQHISQNCFLGKKEFIHRSNDAFKDIAYIFDKDYMSQYIDILFEGRNFMTIDRHKEFLIRSYGEDYMIPPPVEKRKTGHDMTLETLKNI